MAVPHSYSCIILSSFWADLDVYQQPCADSCAHGGDWPAKVLRKRKFHRQNPLELETPKPGELVAKRPSDLGLD